MDTPPVPHESRALPVTRLRFHGLRKLNWVPRDGRSYAEHLRITGFDTWIALGPIAVIVGPNGGGKSTLIDLLRALGDAKVWPGLARENYPGQHFSAFEIEGRNYTLAAQFWPATNKPGYDPFDFQTAAILLPQHAAIWLTMPKFYVSGEWQQRIQSILDDSVRIPVHYREAAEHLPARELEDRELVALLNELSPHFPSVFSNSEVPPFCIFGDLVGVRPERIGVFFKDDTVQPSYVHRAALPSGWLQLASVLSFVRRCPASSLILLDEPDRHLHASLQRVLLELLANEQRKSGHQIVLATHSSVLINPELCSRAQASVIVAARGRCEVLSDSRGVLDDLGVTSADLVHANGIVWVDGPSDRIYLKKWIELYALASGLPVPIERVHYTFANYFGSIMKHMTLTDGLPEKFSVGSINRNFFVVVDRDLDEAAQEALAPEKQRILAEAEACGQSQSVWITQHYTIEAYLPREWTCCARFVRTTQEDTVVVEGITKVELAERFKCEIKDWNKSFRLSSDLPARIAQLFERIQSWQAPQEAIDVTYPLPFDENARQDPSDAK